MTDGATKKERCPSCTQRPLLVVFIKHIGNTIGTAAAARQLHYVESLAIRASTNNGLRRPELIFRRLDFNSCSTVTLTRMIHR